MNPSGSDFERRAYASEAVEAGRLPSPRHRRLVWGLGVVCLSLWAMLSSVVWGEGWGSFLVLPTISAVVNTLLFFRFLRRMREADRAHAEGRPVRFTRG